MGPLKAALYDAVITFLWMMCVSTVGAITAIIAGALHLQGFAPSLAVTTCLIAVLIFVFNLICEAIGGASFNATGNAAFYVAGFGFDTVFSLALRFPAQALGSAGGVLAIVELMPLQYRHTLSGPSLHVDPHTGAFAEGILTFGITLAALWIIIKGPRNPVVKALLLAVTTIAFVVAGTEYTGPSMNPANAFGWAYKDNRHNSWDHFYVYWICPFVGAILAAWVFRLIFPPTAPKVKKA